MTFSESRPTPEHLVATVSVPGMPGRSYAVLIDNPVQPGHETGELTCERVWTEEGLRKLAIGRLSAGLEAVFGIQVTPDALEPRVQFVAYEKRLFN